jgi:hypothetical protein
MDFAVPATSAAEELTETISLAMPLMTESAWAVCFQKDACPCQVAVQHKRKFLVDGRGHEIRNDAHDFPESDIQPKNNEEPCADTKFSQHESPREKGL